MDKYLQLTCDSFETVTESVTSDSNHNDHDIRPSVAIEQKTPADDLIEAGSARGPPPVLPPKPTHPLPSAPESSVSSPAASPSASSPAASPSASSRAASPPLSRLRTPSLRKLARAVLPPPEFSARRHPGGAESVRETGVVVGLQGGKALVSWSSRPKKALQHNSEQLELAPGSTGGDLRRGALVRLRIRRLLGDSAALNQSSDDSDESQEEPPPPLPDDFGVELCMDVMCCPLDDLYIELEGESSQAPLRLYQREAMAKMRADNPVAGVMLETDAFGDIWYKTNKKTKLKIFAKPSESSLSVTNVIRRKLLALVRAEGAETALRMWNSGRLRKHPPPPLKMPDVESRKDLIQKFLEDAIDVAETNRLRTSAMALPSPSLSKRKMSVYNKLPSPPRKIVKGGFYTVRNVKVLIGKTRLRRAPIFTQESAAMSEHTVANGDVVEALDDPVPDRRHKRGPDVFLEVLHKDPATKVRKRGFIRIVNLRDLKGQKIAPQASPFRMFSQAKKETMERMGTAEHDETLDMSNCATSMEVKSLLSTGLLEKMSVLDLWLNDDEVEIDPGKKLGSGGAALIHKGHFRHTPIAIKEMLHVLIYPSLQNVAREGWLLVRLRHPNIVHFYGVWQQRDADLDTFRIYLCMELCEGGNLRTAIDNNKSLDARLTWKWLRQITMAVDYMHSRKPPIIHRDLKPENILLSGGNCKLCDFGLACQTSERSVGFVADLGTLAYMPPEILRANRRMLSRATSLSRSAKNELAKMAAANLKLGKQWDVYSCAMIFCYVLTRVVPFEGCATEEILNRVCDEHVQGRPKLDFVPYAVPKGAEPRLKRMIRAMWHDQAKARPGMPYIMTQLRLISRFIEARFIQ